MTSKPGKGWRCATVLWLSGLLAGLFGGCVGVKHHLHRHMPFAQHVEEHEAGYYHCDKCGRVIPHGGGCACGVIIERPYFGYNAPCWQPWPADYEGCPVQVIEEPFEAVVSVPPIVDMQALPPTVPAEEQDPAVQVLVSAPDLPRKDLDRNGSPIPLSRSPVRDRSQAGALRPVQLAAEIVQRSPARRQSAFPEVAAGRVPRNWYASSIDKTPSVARRLEQLQDVARANGDDPSRAIPVRSVQSPKSILRFPAAAQNGNLPADGQVTGRKTDRNDRSVVRLAKNL